LHRCRLVYYLRVLFALRSCYCWQPEKPGFPEQKTASGGM
jgi:hypothetical protein